MGATKQTVLDQSPESFDEVKTGIAARYATLSPQLQHIARYALEHPNDIALETVATIAGRADVQPSSMVRFAKALGFDGFSDMQQVFRARLMTRSDTYRERIEALRQEHLGGSSSVLGDFTEEGISSLELLREHTDPADIARAVELMATAQRLHVVAARRAFPVACYLSYALNRMEKPAHLLDGIGGTLDQQARLATPDDVMIAISFPPYTEEVADVVEGCVARSVPILALTDSAVSPLALAAQVAFPIKQQSDRTFRSLVAPMCLAQTLVVSLGHHLAASNHGEAGDEQA